MSFLDLPPTVSPVHMLNSAYFSFFVVTLSFLSCDEHFSLQQFWTNMSTAAPASRSSSGLGNQAVSDLQFPLTAQTDPLVKIANPLPLPSKPLLQRGGMIKVDTKMLHLDKQQVTEVEEHYVTSTIFHQLFSEDLSSQQAAMSILNEPGLTLRNLADLGNGWSIRWSTRRGKGNKRFAHILLQW
ncbi:hypothetical protein K439DRAFT_1624364 [Ramaria rubella]|nr:hypothetical protein K439DRAFT_1624364 [Ramaria rubella]